MREDAQPHCRVPRAYALREGVRSARCAVESIPDDTVQPLHPDGPRIEGRGAEAVPHLDLLEAKAIAVLHHLGQPHAGRGHHPRPTSASASHRIAIRPPDQRDVRTLPIADPADAAVSGRAFARQRHDHPGGGVFALRRTESHHETARPMLAQAPPALALLFTRRPGAVRCIPSGLAHPLFLGWLVWSVSTAFPTNDQKASTSTSSNSRSFTSSSVSLSACSPARISQSRTVSHL